MLQDRNWQSQQLVWKGRFVYNSFSNFEEGEKPILFGGMEHKTVETAYQAAKTLDPDLRCSFAQMSAGASKKAGRKLKVREDWEQVKLAAMDMLVRQKFAPGTKEMVWLLARTGEIVEWNNWGDRYWGADLKGVGKNALGLILMDIREGMLRTGLVTPGAAEEDWAEHSIVLAERLNAIPNLEATSAQPKLF